jgi:hypothetical protein
MPYAFIAGGYLSLCIPQWCSTQAALIQLVLVLFLPLQLLSSIAAVVGVLTGRSTIGLLLQTTVHGGLVLG